MGKGDHHTDELWSESERPDVMCIAILAIICTTIVCFMFSAIAVFRSSYIAEHQDELIALLATMSPAQHEAIHEAVHQIDSALHQNVDSLVDTTYQPDSRRISSISSYSTDFDFIVNDSFVLPPTAIRLSANTYLIGEKEIEMTQYNRKRGIIGLEETEPVYQKIQVLAHIHWEKSEPIGLIESATTTCYGFNAIGAFWKKTEDYKVGFSNTEGLSDTTIDSNVKTSIHTWLENIPQHQVIGTRLSSSPDGVGSNEPDGNNELVFGAVSTAGVIAVTITYGVFSGPVANREIVEWDMIINQRDYNFGDATVDSSKMDFQSILTHEFGHVLGLADIYTSSCSQVTMYGK